MRDEPSLPEAGRERAPLFRRKRRVLQVALLAGGAVAVLYFVLHVGVPAIAGGLRALGWKGIAAVSAFHLIPTSLMGLAWWNLRRAAAPWIYVWGRLLRDAGSELLPLSQVGGYALGARLPILAGSPPRLVLASVVVDATLEFLSQVAFVALGTVLALLLSNSLTLAGPALIWIVAALAAASAFILLQARGHDLLNLAVGRFGRKWFAAILAGAALAQAQLRRLHRRKAQIVQSFGLHFTAWLLAGVEAWLILRLMGDRQDFATVLVLESLLYAARSLAFVVPGAIGVQEGAYLLLGAALGIPSEAVLALSLAKRARDLVLGSAALASWHFLEGRRLREPQAPRD